MTKYSAWIVAAVIGTQFAAASAMADDTADAIAALKKQIEQLSAKVQQLENEHQAEIQHAAASQTNSSAVVSTAGSSNAIPELGFVTAGSNGFWLRSSDSNFTLRLQGVGQLDGHYYQSLNPVQKDTLTVRRLRLIESGSVYKDYD